MTGRKKKPPTKLPFAKWPWYGATQIWTFVIVRGHVLPVVGFSDQYIVQFPDGTKCAMEPWDCDSPFEKGDVLRNKAAIKERELSRVERGAFRNEASTATQVELAFRRNAGKFVEDLE